MEMNRDGAITHTALVKRMLALDLSASTMRRIIDPITEGLCQENLDEFIQKEKEIIEHLKPCETEEDVIRVLDSIGM